MPKLPVMSGIELVRVLERAGYRVVRQKGSHVRLRPPDPSRGLPTTVPLHRELKPGTLQAILRDANLSIDDLERGL